MTEGAVGAAGALGCEAGTGVEEATGCVFTFPYAMFAEGVAPVLYVPRFCACAEEPMGMTALGLFGSIWYPAEGVMAIEVL